MKTTWAAAPVAVCVLTALCSVRAQTPLTTVLVADGFNSPVQVTHVPGDFNRLFIVQQPGWIAVIKNGAVLPTRFLDLKGPVQQVGSEQGLLGMAFDPAYAANGFFYVAYTGPEPADTFSVERYRVSANPDVADPGSGVTVLSVPHPFREHNGGWLGFGPDGYLYISSGDGGDACDPFQNAQDPDSLLGKILRISVATLPYSIPPNNPFAVGGGRPEILAFGLRNPWRCSIDRATGDLWIGDVGQSAQEEVDLIPAPGPGPVTARNFGWDCREGLVCASATPSGCPVAHCPPGCASPSFTEPVHAYGHQLACAVTGGHVYRGCAIPDLDGTYFFADFCSARISSFRHVGGAVTELTDRTAELAPGGGLSIDFVSGFGEDAFGELYICDYIGEVYRVVPASPVGPDCNNNQRRDACDILSGYSTDGNANGVPDECECYANCTGNYLGSVPVLSVADFGCFQGKFVLQHPYADCNTDGVLSVADFGCFQGKYVLGCP